MDSGGSGRSRAPVVGLPAVASKFWQERLAGSEAMQRLCEDGSEFAKVFAEWREAEKQEGRRTPFDASRVMHALSQQRKLRVKKAGDGVVVVVFSSSSGEATDAMARVTASRAGFERDKGGIVVDPVTYDVPIPKGSTVERRIGIRNGGRGAVSLTSVRLVRGTTGYSVSHGFTLPLKLQGGHRVELVLRCTPQQPGVVCDTLSLSFGGFGVGRCLRARCGDVELLQELAPSTPYQKPKRRAKGAGSHAQKEELPPPPPASTDGTPLGALLGMFGDLSAEAKARERLAALPRHEIDAATTALLSSPTALLSSAFDSGSEGASWLARALVKQPLSPKSYAEWWRGLLWCRPHTLKTRPLSSPIPSRPIPPHPPKFHGFDAAAAQGGRVSAHQRPLPF